MIRGSLFRSSWNSLYEPRWVTALTVLTYLLCGYLGVITITGASLAYETNAFVSTLTGLFLLGAMFVGVPTAWRGVRWLERVAALSMTAGFTVWGVYLLTVHLLPNPWHLTAPETVAIGCLVSAISGLVRLARIIEDPYAPGRGPLLPERENQIADRKVISQYFV